MDQAIGGYFGLELSTGTHYHHNAIYLNSARNCLEYILITFNYSKVYIPYYTCDVILEPFVKTGTQYEYYYIDKNLDPVFDFSLNENEAFLYTNYFGLKQDTVNRLASILGCKLIVDNSQAFFSSPLDGINTFYSPRKFIGVSDGGYLYLSDNRELSIEQEDSSVMRFSHLIKRVDIDAESGFNDFKKNDSSLIDNPIKRMSKLSMAILSGVDYENIRLIRRNNYSILDQYLSSSNQFEFNLDESTVPMVYPYISSRDSLKEKLIKNKVYVATYWPNVMKWCKRDDVEYNLANHALFLPIDQRYGAKEMEKIIKLICE